MMTERGWHADNNHICLSQPFQVPCRFEQPCFAHCGNTVIIDMPKRTLAEVKASDLFLVDVKSKNTKVLRCCRQHQWQADISHADDANLRRAVADARGESLMVYFYRHCVFIN